MQFGTNHLGHFALTGLLLETMLPVPGSRVVTVSSNGYRVGRIDFAGLTRRVARPENHPRRRPISLAE